MSSLVGNAARRLRSNPGAMCAMFILLGMVALTLFGPWLNPNGGETLDWLHVASKPALQNAHWFGTDRLGRDLFARTLEGTRVSLAVGLVASVVSLLVGIGYGASRGLHRRTHRSCDDAHHRDIERPAADLLRHISDRHFRPQRISACSCPSARSVG